MAAAMMTRSPAFGPKTRRSQCSFERDDRADAHFRSPFRGTIRSQSAFLVGATAIVKNRRAPPTRRAGLVTRTGAAFRIVVRNLAANNQGPPSVMYEGYPSASQTQHPHAVFRLSSLSGVEGGVMSGRKKLHYSTSL